MKREGTSESRAGGKDLSFKEQLLKGKKYFESCFKGDVFEAMLQ